MLPKISVIITTYNRSEYLEKRAIPSCLNQEYENFEILIIDDCSKDNTKFIVNEIQKKYKNKDIRYLRLEKNKGLAFCRNFGVANAKGDFVVFLDDDDAFSEKFLISLVPVLNNAPDNVGAVVSGRLIIPEGSKVQEGSLSIPSWEGSYSSIDDGWLLKKKVFSEIKNDERLYMDEDADFGIQFFQRFRAISIREPLLFKYIQKNSYSSPSIRRIESARLFLEKNIETIKKIGTKRDVSYIYRQTGKYFCGGGKKGGVYFIKSFFIEPNLRSVFYFLLSLFGKKYFNSYVHFESKIIHILRSFQS